VRSTNGPDATDLSHLSIELGHLNAQRSPVRLQQLQQHFQQIAPWVNTARQACVSKMQKQDTKSDEGNWRDRRPRARVSTCLLVDDYFAPCDSPAQLVPILIAAAREAGLEIDYVARESGCVDANGIPLARLLEERLGKDHRTGTHHGQPLLSQVGWLCNGQRSRGSLTTTEAMHLPQCPSPLGQKALYRHSIFLDVQLWDESSEQRTWSCPLLAAVWQLLRLGAFRDDGDRVTVPRQWRGQFPDDWTRMPPVTQLNAVAAPFRAYRTISILATRFLPVEHAVRTILSQMRIEGDALSEVMEQSRAEGIPVPLELVDRIGYIFAD
jgi:hypothetical protein